MSHTHAINDPAARQLPQRSFSSRFNDPELYRPSPELWAAVQTALHLGLPLLLTGEPGCGKTDLAAHLAWYYGLGNPEVFNGQTSSSVTDLFYRYDALRHFQHAQVNKESLTPELVEREYIQYQALGAAIKSKATKVVLIDEIDKAPRDFPNDILNEIENLDFRIKELDNREFRHHDSQRIVVIMTSNSEKNLPDAFLRRCVFYHIPFPPADQLFAIAKTQLGLDEQISPQQEKVLSKLIEYFYKVREVAVRKPPATAELIAWLNMMGLPMDAPTADLKDLQPLLLRNLSLLVKTREDLNAIRKWMNEGFVDWV